MWGEDAATDTNTQVSETDALDRMVRVMLVDAFERSAMTKKAFAEHHGVPRTTFTHWALRKQRLEADPEWVAFFESPAGLRFLHRLMVALHLVFGLMGACGLRQRALFVQLCGLEPFLALSLGAMHQQMSHLLALVVAFADDQRRVLAPRLADEEAPRPLTVCADETFHPEVCLVAVEPASGFILLEQYATEATGEAWIQALEDALDGLPVEIVQMAVDGGKALASCGRHFDANLSPDLFHIQREPLRALMRPMGRLLADVQTPLEQARQRLLELEATLAASDAPGEAYVARPAARRAHAQAQAAFDHVQAGHDKLLGAVRGLSRVYHLFDLETGQIQTAKVVRKRLEAHLDAMDEVIEAHGLPASGREAVAKARRQLDAMEDTVQFVHHELGSRLADLELSPSVRTLVLEELVGAVYLERVSGQLTGAEARKEVAAVAECKRARFDAALPSVWPEADEADAERLVAWAKGGAALFQRSTSCVEGRNGHLARHHHGLHRLDGDVLAALTCLHNYFIRRHDGTTAAERFFSHPPDDLYDFLLRRMPWPARPAQRRAELPYRFGA